ncbi:hypothetical protein ACWPKO_00530 [Coraliomargarita sp. W4R53]
MNITNLKKLIENYPRLYLAVLNLKRTGHWSRHWIVRADTDITIEGFPRSGNSFARSAFHFSQDREHKIATHVHSHAQIIRSVQLHIPTMVLVRSPKDACLSLVALTYQIHDTELSDQMIARAKNDLINHLASYKRFYENVLRVGDRIIIAEFNLVTTDYGEVIRRINSRYNTDFSLYEASKDNETKVFKEGGFHLSPNATRDNIKAAIHRCYDLDELQSSIADAEAVYEQVLKLEQQQAAKYSPVL